MNRSGKKENSLLNYFARVGGDSKPKKESMSTIIAKTTPVRKPTKPTRVAAPIHLIEDDEDMIDLTMDTDSILASPSSSQTSQRPQYEEWSNTCKYNKKAWSAESKSRGHTPSSQTPSQEQPIQRFERIELKKATSHFKG